LCWANECAQLETSRIWAYYIYRYEYKTRDPRAGHKGGGLESVLVDAIHLSIGNNGQKRTFSRRIFRAAPQFVPFAEHFHALRGHFADASPRART
jgi:hypothetical protein